MRAALLALAALNLSSCASLGYDRVSVRELADHPERWDGRWVETQGLVVREFEDYGLYERYATYCPGEKDGRAIYVEWPRGRISSADDRRLAVVRGRFFHVIGTTQKNDKGEEEYIISNGAPGPGPLSHPHIVRWLSEQMPLCPGAIPGR